MKKSWVNPLVERDRLAAYLVGDDQEIVFRKQVRYHDWDLSLSVIDAEVDRAFLRSLLATARSDQRAMELAIAAEEQVSRVQTKGLPIPDPDDDLLFNFRARLWQIEPRLEARSFSSIASEIALIVKALLLEDLDEGQNE